MVSRPRNLVGIGVEPYLHVLGDIVGIEGAFGDIPQHIFGAVVAGYDDESFIMAIVEHIVAGILGRSAILVGLLFSLIGEVEGSAGCHTSLCKESPRVALAAIPLFARKAFAFCRACSGVTGLATAEATHSKNKRIENSCFFIIISFSGYS